MADFHKVHCTNCGSVLAADEMAVDVDKILRKRLARSEGREQNRILAEAKRVFDEIRIGMYLTKQQLIDERMLDGDGTLHLTCRNILDFIGKRYGVNLAYVEKYTKEPEEGDEAFFEEEENGENAGDFWGGRTDGSDLVIAPETLESLCKKMKLYEQKDNAEEEKRSYILDMLQLLLRHEEYKLLNYNCKFFNQTDDQGKEFVSSVEVSYEDDEKENDGNMVCPKCGEPFFSDAGRYKEHIIVMLGSSRVGKTAYLAALVEEINPEYGRPRYKNITIRDTVDKRYTYFKDNILKQYREGRKIIKTDELKETVALFSLDVLIGDKMTILTFVDLPGEAFVPRSEEEKKAGRVDGRFIINERPICGHADMFWFCIDPVQIDRRLYKLNDKVFIEDKVEQDMALVFANVTSNVSRMGNEKSNVPTAVIITKSDLIAAEANLYFKSREFEPECMLPDGNLSIDRLQNVTAEVIKYLQSDNIKNVMAKLDDMFAEKNYFAVAAYGVNVEESGEGSRKAPSGIIIPFLWSLSVLGYLKPMRYELESKPYGFLGRKERVTEGHVEAEREALFVHDV